MMLQPGMLLLPAVTALECHGADMGKELVQHMTDSDL